MAETGGLPQPPERVAQSVVVRLREGGLGYERSLVGEESSPTSD
jgi:hypothetical protein